LTEATISMLQEVLTEVLVAALYDIHANIHALEAVLSELQGLPVDLIVVGGDVAAGPFPAETLDRLLAFPGPVRFVLGNADRSLIDPPEPEEDDAWVQGAIWCAARLTQGHLDLLASFEPVVEVDIPPMGTVLFCHGSPRSDEEIITKATPEEALADALDGVTAGVVVCGHTHMQFDRMVDSIRVINAGSVGMPYEARPGAYWALLGGPDVDLRRTDYDFEAAASAIGATDWPPAQEFALENVRTVPHPDEVIPQFEARREEARN
jgi:predicted phosphodiesterase